MGRLDGKVAIITGGASGMGEASAGLFVQEGARVVIGDVQDDKAAALAGSLGSACVAAHTDVTGDEDMRRLVRTAVDRFGKLDVMFNNAGGGRRLTPEELEQRTRIYGDAPPQRRLLADMD